MLIGCGKMGHAMLDGWLANGIAPSVIMDRHLETVPKPHRIIRDTASLPEDFSPEFIVLAVKPAGADAALAELGPRFPQAVVLSVMAGRTLASLTAHGAPTAIRAMPNTPASIGKGMTVACPGPGISETQRIRCSDLLEAVGDVAWIEEEDALATITAISGSGPAYLFLLSELMEKAGIEQGLPEDLARLLARKTLSGAGALLDSSPMAAAELRRAVTSPNGTTQSALDALMAEDAWPRSVRNAIDAATHRARELAS